MAPSTSLRPIAPKAFGYAQAQHLLARAGFGGTPAQILALQNMGLDKAVDHLVDYQAIDDHDLPEPKADPDIMRPESMEDRLAERNAKREDEAAYREKKRAEFLRRQGLDRLQMRDLAEWWLARMIATPRPLEEKLTLLWHGHFASNHRVVHDSYLLLRQNQMFRKLANGSFADLAYAIVRDPAMIKFLNNDSNVARHPNENLARELMELFTLGVGHYTEQDIKEGARALTGNSFDDNEFRFRAPIHDGGVKTILGQFGPYDGEQFVRVILQNRQCPVWVATKLYKHFVGDIDLKPDASAESVVAQLAEALWGAQYELKPTLKTLFKSQHFYEPAIMGNQIKSPAQIVVGSARVLGAPQRDVRTLHDAMAMMGQRLFDPPSVAGWYGGRGWINTSTLFVRQNLCAYILTGKLPLEDGWSAQKLDFDPMFLIADLPTKSPEAVADHLLATLLGTHAPDRRDDLVRFLKGRSAGITRDVLVGALLLITALPEYQLC
ncbi:MAG: DUF1800 domain-containing protein [Planctomycetota bacterium]|nr:DUF1800 domain-containing protein [Planctomycetota bacterium]